MTAVYADDDLMTVVYTDGDLVTAVYTMTVTDDCCKYTTSVDIQKRAIKSDSLM